VVRCALGLLVAYRRMNFVQELLHGSIKLHFSLDIFTWGRLLAEHFINFFLYVSERLQVASSFPVRFCGCGKE
jgi:hypothetical protein